jgi:hypothetical protein
MTTIHLLPKVDCRWGAPMGRVDSLPQNNVKPQKLYLRRVRLNGGGYDSSGAYWGLGAPLWRCYDDTGKSSFLRANSREIAQETIREEYPDARFYR